MDPLLSTLLLILLALLGARVSFSEVRVPQGPRLLLRTGIHFLFIGFLLGPQALGLLSVDAVEQLFPLLALGLGWVGFLFGLQLDRTALRRFPRSWIWITVIQAVLTFVIFLGLGWAMLGAVGRTSPVEQLLLAGCAATAAVSAPAGVALVSTNFLVRGNVRTLLFFVASLDGVVGIVALQLVYAWFRPADMVLTLSQTPSGWAPALAMGVGVACAILFLWLNRPRPSSDALFLFLLGMAAFASGLALRLQLSPLFVCMVLGALVANLSSDRQRVFRLLQGWEQPVYLIFLLLGGALLQFSTLWILPMAFAYAIFRAVGKVVGTLAATRIAPAGFPIPKRLGEGLVTQGGLSVAMALSGVLTYQGLESGGASEELIFAVVVMGVVLSDLAGPLLTTDVLRRAGEISPRVEEALAQGDERGAETAALRHVPSGPAGEAPDDGDDSSPSERSIP
jgi:hypothetical protein